MRGWVLGVVLAVAPGCSLYTSSDTPPDAAEPVPENMMLDVDVLVAETGLGTRIEVQLRDPPHLCECSSDLLPPSATECDYSSDGIYCGCSPAPGECLTSVALVDGGELIELDSPWLDSDPTERWAFLEGDVPEVMTLRLEGCGAISEITVPIGPFPEPLVFDDYWVDLDERIIGVTWPNPDDPVRVLSWTSNGLGGPTCYDPDGAAELDHSDWAILGVSSVVGGQPTPIPHGVARVWQTGYGQSVGPQVPIPDDAGGLNLRAVEPQALVVDTLEGLVELDVGGITVGADGMMEFYANRDGKTLHYQASSAGDTLSWSGSTYDLQCQSTVPHTPPSDPLELGKLEHELVTINFPSTAIYCWPDGPDRPIAFDLTLDLGQLPRYQ